MEKNKKNKRVPPKYRRAEVILIVVIIIIALICLSVGYKMYIEFNEINNSNF